MKRIISAFIGVLASLVTLKSAAQIKKNIRISFDNENLLKVDAISNILQQKNIDITKDESLKAVLDDHAILNEILNELGSKENLKSNTSDQPGVFIPLPRLVLHGKLLPIWSTGFWNGGLVS